MATMSQGTEPDLRRTDQEIRPPSRRDAQERSWLGIPRRPGSLLSALVKQEKEMIETALAASHGQVSGPSGAATKLGLPSRTLDSKIKRLKINVYRFKTAH